MSDQTLRRIGWTISGLSILAAPSAIGLVVWAGVPDQIVTSYSLAYALNSLCYGALGLVLVKSEPRNRLVWFFVAVGFCNAVTGVVNGSVEVLAAEQGVGAEQIDTAGWPPGVATLVAHAWSVWIFGNFGLLTLGLLLAPSGRLLSRRWLPVAVASAASITVLWLTTAANWPLRDDDEQDQLVSGWAEVAFVISFSVLVVSVVASFASLLLRYRRSDNETRRRLRWVLFGSTVFVIAFFPAIFGPEIVLAVFFPIVGVSYGMAIWRDQLFDVDLVISRTLLFGSLAVFIGIVYVAVVFGLGAAIGQRGGGGQTLSLLATVVVAFLFHPMRQRFERAANRLVYGRRATPYEVLSDLSGRLARTESTDGLLDRMAALMADGTGAERAVVWRWSDPGYEPLAVWPPDLAVEPAPELVDAEAAVPIERSGQHLGALTVTKARGDELNPTERRLLDDLAGSAGLVLDRARLDVALSEQAAALVRSRRRLIGAQDEERHRLEHQLQTGTREQLTVLASGLDAGADTASGEGIEPIAGQLAALADEARTAHDEIQALAHGVYPPLLEADGLIAAVESLAATSTVPAKVASTGYERLDVDVELAVYFCIAEALTNVAKHAEASMISVGVRHRDGVLSFEVTDDGVGFVSTNGNSSSTGLAGLNDRIDAVGGNLTIRSTPGEGTTVAGSVPTALRAATAVSVG